MMSGAESAKSFSLPKMTALWNRSNRLNLARSTIPGRSASAHTPSVAAITPRPSRTALKLKINELILLDRSEEHDAVEGGDEEESAQPPGRRRIKVDKLDAPAIAGEIRREHHCSKEEKPQRKRRPRSERGEQRQQISRGRAEEHPADAHEGEHHQHGQHVARVPELSSQEIIDRQQPIEHQQRTVIKTPHDESEARSEEHTSELQSRFGISYAVFS